MVTGGLKIQRTAYLILPDEYVGGFLFKFYKNDLCLEVQ